MTVLLGVEATGLALLHRAMALGQISVVAPISACGAGLPVIVGLALGGVCLMATY